MSKNIIICCDGTNNEVSGHQTNVLRLFRMLVRDETQLGYYDPGVGTQSDSTAHRPLKGKIYRGLDAAVGIGIRDNVLDAYRYLMREYEEGDRIYLYGFSRGAYTVRALASMLHYCGLLHSGHEHLSAHAWGIFTDESKAGNLASRFRGAARIKKIFSRSVDVHFLGAWDTVSSFGWIWSPQMVPNSARCKGVKNIRHALSIDERRAYFQPNHFGPGEEQDAVSVWFPGVHADVGGGYSAKEGSLSRIALEWMLGESFQHGILLDPRAVALQLKKIDDSNGQASNGDMHDESKKIGWRLLGILPRRVFVFDKKRLVWRWPNPARKRVIPENAIIHKSVLQRMDEKGIQYTPKLPKQYKIASTIPWHKVS